MRFRNILLSTGLASALIAGYAWHASGGTKRFEQQLRSEMALLTGQPAKAAPAPQAQKPAAPRAGQQDAKGATPAVREERTLEARLDDKPLLGPAIIDSNINGKMVREKLYAHNSHKRYFLGPGDSIRLTLPTIAKRHEASGYSVRWIPTSPLVAGTNIDHSTLRQRTIARTEGHIGLFRGSVRCESYKIEIEARPRLNAHLVPPLKEALATRTEPKAERYRPIRYGSILSQPTVPQDMPALPTAPPTTTDSPPAESSRSRQTPQYSGVRIQREDGTIVAYEELPISKDAASRIVKLPTLEEYRAQLAQEQHPRHTVRVTSAQGTRYIDPATISVPSLTQGLRSAR